MTTFLFITVVLVGLTLAGLVRELRRDPVHHVPASHLDAFAPRWVDAGTGRWSF